MKHADRAAPDATAREAGEAAFAAVRRVLARKAAEAIRLDPDAADVALEIGLIDRRWLDDPGGAPLSSAKPHEVIERFWERMADTRPSRLANLGLGTVQLLAGRMSASPGRPEHLTVLFTDLEGFTTYTARHGDTAAVALLSEHHRLAGPAVRREGGRVVKHIGDGMLCTFGDPQGALRAAVALLELAPEPLRLRAGIHTGEVIAGSHDVIGHAVNVAARVVESASGGRAVATLEAVEEAGPTRGVVVGKSRSRRLKGIGRMTLVDVSRDPALRVPLAVTS